MASLLTLPPELRTQIYTLLLPHSPVSHPIPSVGLTSVTHQPPALQYLLIHPLLTAEILDHYFTAARWKLIFSHAFNFFRVDPYLQNLEKSAVLPRLKKVEVVFFCDILLLREYPSFGLEAFCGEIRRRAQRACEVLLAANGLSEVVVSWIDTTLAGGWEEKIGILEPLRILTGKREGDNGDVVRFRVGEVSGVRDDMDREGFIRALERVLGMDMVGEKGSRDAEVASRLRMLAFDPRQERDRLTTGEKTIRSCTEFSGTP